VKAVIDAHAWMTDAVLARARVRWADAAQTQQMFAIDLDGITAHVAITRIE